MITKIKSSFLKNRFGILLMLVSSLAVCLGQLFWKLSESTNIPLLLVGFVLYAVGAIIMIIAYRHGSLSVLQPVLSANYILSIIFGYYILSESISVNKIVGIVIIMIGLILISGGDFE